MTDTAELLKQDEKAPDHKSEAKPAGTGCEYCTAWFDPPFAHAKRGSHTKKEHPEHWTGPSATWGKAKAAAKNGKAPVRKAPAKSPAVRKAAPVRPPAAPPAARSGRVSLAPRVAWTWKFLGQMMQKEHMPAEAAVIGNMLVFEAPAAGAAVDKAVAGTRLDRKVFQRAARTGERFEAVGRIAKLPGLAMLICLKPDLYEDLEDDLREAVEDVLIDAVPVIEERARRTRSAEDALRRLAAADSQYAGDDPIGTVLKDLFSPIRAPRPLPPEGDAGPGE